MVFEIQFEKRQKKKTSRLIGYSITRVKFKTIVPLIIDLTDAEPSHLVTEWSYQ